MKAAEIAFKFLKRGMRQRLSISSFAALAYLAANGERTTLQIIQALGLSEGSRNRGSVLDRHVENGLISRRFLSKMKGGGGFLYSVTPKGLRVLGLKQSNEEVL
jgi:DNA-binding MarR family transcriptional regulator